MYAFFVNCNSPNTPACLLLGTGQCSVSLPFTMVWILQITFFVFCTFHSTSQKKWMLRCWKQDVWSSCLSWMDGTRSRAPPCLCSWRRKELNSWNGQTTALSCDSRVSYLSCELFLRVKREGSYFLPYRACVLLLAAAAAEECPWKLVSGDWPQW